MSRISNTSTPTAIILIVIASLFTPLECKTTTAAAAANNNGSSPGSVVSASAASPPATVCILAPPGYQNLQQLDQQQQQQLLAQGLIPGIYRSDDPRYNILPITPQQQLQGNFFDQQFRTNNDAAANKRPGNFWDQPVNSTTPQSSGRSDRPGSRFSQSSDQGYLSDDPSMQQQRIPFSSFDPQQQQQQQQQPVRPQYDRSGFRREPLHPSYNPIPNQGRVPVLVPNDASTQQQQQQNDAERRSNNNNNNNNNEPWSRFGTKTTQAPSVSRRGDAPAPQTSFFDPTRRPKTAQNNSPQNQNQSTKDGTTRKPFYTKNGAYSGNQQPGSRKNPSFNPANTRTQTPGLTNEVPTSTRSPFDPSSRPDVIPNNTVPEYAYIKQPISKVLDQPDLELEGKPVKFGILKDALDRVGLLELMSQSSPVTVFAPTDEAFLALPSETLTRMQQNPNFLRNTMLRHIVNFDMPPDTLRNNIIVPSYSGEPLILNVIGKLMMVKGTPIIAATNTENGVIYVINKVMTEETASATVVEELAGIRDASTFYQYISRSTQIRRLQGQGPFTILAPNNTAFERLPSAIRQVLDYNPIVLEKLLSFHIIEGAVFKKELEATDSIGASGNPVTGQPGRVEPIKLKTLPDGSIKVNDVATIQTSDISSGNGVVHVIDEILIPAELVPTFRKIENRALFNPVTRTPLVTTASNRNSQATLQRDQPSIRPSFGFSSNEESNSQPRDPRRDRNANFAIRSGSGANDGNSLNQNNRDSQAAPRSNDDETSIRFYRWIRKSGFLEVLNNTGNNYTVILPIDRAVNRLPLKYQQSLETNPRQLESLLMYHIVPGIVNMSRLKDEDTIPTVSGKDIRFNRINNGTNTTNTSTSSNNRSIFSNPNSKQNSSTPSLPNVTFSGATLIGSDKTPNGKITFLLVDRVMYPPQGNLFDVISNSPILKSLSNLIKVAGLEAGLSDTGPFTLFAPSDEAFQKLPLESIDYLSHDPQSSRAFLLRHIIRPVLFTSSVPIGNSTVIESTTGERLQIIREKDVVKVDGVSIKYADITATNGVIHVIDHVL